MENILINNYHYLFNIKDLIFKIIKKNNYIYDNKNYNKLIFFQKKKFICFFKTYYGIDWWYKFYKLYKIEWVWSYEYLLLFYMYRIYLVDLYWILILLWIKTHNINNF
jgi:hypothetical protein